MFFIFTNQSFLIKTILLIVVLFVLFFTPVFAQIGGGVLPPINTATTPAEGVGAGALSPAQNTTPSATTGTSQSMSRDWKIETGIPIAGLKKGTAVKDPGTYFNKIYTFAVSASMVVAIIMVVYAGLMWMTSPYLVQKKEAIDRMTGVALGILLLLGSNLILKTINPNLVNWNLSGLTSVEGLGDSIFGIGVEGTAGGGGNGGGNNNYTNSGEGACSTNSLGKYFRNTKELATAMCVCIGESGGNPASLNKDCLQGGADFSVGGMQYNLWTGGRCPGAFENSVESTTAGTKCIVKDKAALIACAEKVGVKLEQSGNSFQVTGIDWDKYMEKAVVPLQQSISGWGNWSTYAGGCDTGWTRYRNDAEDYLINN